MTAMQVINTILIMFSQLFRFAGMAVLGLGLGWLTLDLLKKLTNWQGQVAIYLGLAGLIIALTVFTGWGALGAFTLGIGIAIFLWGIPRKAKEKK